MTQPRRTQAERREETIRKLLDAGIDALADVGYSRSTVKEICLRAGVSQGGLFRHFPSREALMVAVGEDVGRTTLTEYRQELEASLERGGDPLRVAIELVQRRCRTRVNLAWYELAMAARTSDALRDALAPVAERYYRNIEALARELLPELAAAFGDDFRLVLHAIIALFDGESVHRFVVPDTPLSEGGAPLMAHVVRLMASAR